MKRPKPQRITARSLSDEVTALREEVEALKREIERLKRQPVPQDPWAWPSKPYTPMPLPHPVPDDRDRWPLRPYYWMSDRLHAHS